MDCQVSHGDLASYEFCQKKLEEIAEEELRPAPLLDDNALAELGFSPGPLFSEILTALEDEQLEGRLRTPEDAKAFVLSRYPPN